MALIEVLFNEGNMFRLAGTYLNFGENVNVFLAMC